jgi:hypothetical protein
MHFKQNNDAKLSGFVSNVEVGSVQDMYVIPLQVIHKTDSTITTDIYLLG